MRSIHAAEAVAAAIDGAVLVDVRSRLQFERDGLPGSVNVPLNEIRARTVSPALRQDARLLLLCDHGHLSELAGLYLEQAGFKDVANVLGGLLAIRRLGAG